VLFTRSRTAHHRALTDPIFVGDDTMSNEGATPAAKAVAKPPRKEAIGAVIHEAEGTDRGEPGWAWAPRSRLLLFS
jgi:hypothetical protein